MQLEARRASVRTVPMHVDTPRLTTRLMRFCIGSENGTQRAGEHDAPPGGVKPGQSELWAKMNQAKRMRDLSMS